MMRYGKPSASLLGHKQSFFSDNDRLLKEKLDICRLYTAQPRRARCKNCDDPLGAVSFVKHDVPYAVCGRCGHLNGMHEDSDAFCETAYTGEAEGAYAAGYRSADAAAYARRVNDIYVPKAEFLRDAFLERKARPETLAYTDVGAGSGYFVAAMLKLGFGQVTGYEVSRQQVAFGNAAIGQARLVHHAMDDIVDIVAGLKSPVMSMIGVLEHVQMPREVLAAMRDNRNIRYFYFSVPLFSPSSFIEAAFPSVMPRQLTARHTHLYTESSIDWMCKEFGWVRRSEWWFGTDLVDLYRNMSVRLSQDAGTAGMVDQWQSMMLPLLDAMQLEADRRHLSSEVHMLLEKPA